MRLGSEGFICLKQWITRFSILTNGLNASLLFLSYVTKLFSERVIELSLCFANACVLAINTVFTIDYIDGGAREMISNLNGSLGSKNVLEVMNERTSFASTLKLESLGLILNF